MNNRGQFLEISIPTGDIRASLDFYQRLAFTELPVNDIREHYYAVVTDGRIAIGLHSHGYEQPSLTFVWPDVARQVRRFKDAGHEFEFARLGADDFHEAGVCSPDAHALRLLEARTFSRRRFADAGPTVLGQVTDISLRCIDYRLAVDFWQATGFIVDDDNDEDLAEREVVILRAPGIALALRRGFHWPEPTLRFTAPDLNVALAELDRREFERRRHGDGWVITAPEGTCLLLVPQVAELDSI